MSTQEFSTEFDVLYNNVTSNQAPGINEYEKSVFLTKAQAQLVNEYFNQRTDGFGGGFDGSQKRQYDFSSITRIENLFEVNSFGERITSTEKLDRRSKVFLFPQDYFLAVNEILSDDKWQYSVTPISHSEYQRLMLKPYNFPVKRGAWRIITNKKSCNCVHEDSEGNPLEGTTVDEQDPNKWYYTWKGLPLKQKVDEQVVEFEYSFEEINVDESYFVTMSDDGTTVTNTLRKKIQFIKKVMGADDPLEGAVFTAVVGDKTYTMTSNAKGETRIYNCGILPTTTEYDADGNLITKTEDGVKLITIGLSTKDVDGGSEMLKTIANDVDGDGIPEFYEAEKAKDLEYILLRILRSIMAKGLVRGTVTDTIDKGFYPVDVLGNPLSAGVYNANGTRIQNARITDYVSNGKPTNAHQNDVFYTWEQVGDEWKITWYNQEIGWNDNNNTTGNPWTGTVYVKAKEDYLGGNLIETNDGNAQIEPTGLKLVINGTPETEWRSLEKMNAIDLPVPRVNVHNLETNENSTTFTVYKGTSVTPKEQLEALWNNISIEEVVNASEDGQHKRTIGATANVGNEGTGETFTLSSLMSEVAPGFNIDTLIDQITAVNASASQEFIYTAYGHESGKITIKVERTLGNQNAETHTADTVGTPVEKYKVTFTYKPYTEVERMNGKVKDPTDKDHHNGTNGRGAEETGEIKSENTHTINVFQKGIKITKVDKTDISQALPGAVFELFRVDSAGEADVSAYNLPAGTYSKVGGDLTADANGSIVINPVIPDKDSAVTDKTLYEPDIDIGAATGTSHDTVFYLVEKTPPTKNGVTYAKMPGAIKFTMTLTESKGTDSTATLYDWTQIASLSAEEHGNGSAAYIVEDEPNTITGTNSDTYAYKLRNGRATDITIIKIDKVTRDSIGGAKFRLLKGFENVDLTKLTITAINGGAAVTPEDYDFNGTNIKVITVPEGGIRIAGLVDDTYTLQEVSAPAGYIITNADLVRMYKNDELIKEYTLAFEVENEPGAALPGTGGSGTTILYLFGIMFTGLAFVGLVMRKRKKTV